MYKINFSIFFQDQILQESVLSQLHKNILGNFIFNYFDLFLFLFYEIENVIDIKNLCQSNLPTTSISNFGIYGKEILGDSFEDHGKQIMKCLIKFNAIHEVAPIEDQLPALSQQTLSEIQNLYNKKINQKQNIHERFLVNLCTPEIQSIIEEIHPEIRLINSEEYSWLHGASEDSRCDMKPDLLVAYHAIVEELPPYDGAPDCAVPRKFGRFPCWNCCPSIWCLLDAKWKIDIGAFGESCKYLQLCGQYYKDWQGEELKLKLILFDVEEFWMITSCGVDITMLKKCKWNQPGSRNELKTFITTTDHWMIATENLLIDLGKSFHSLHLVEPGNQIMNDQNVTPSSELNNNSRMPLPPSILGAGSYGRVYRLSNGEVLKVALDNSTTLLEKEYKTILRIQSNPSISHFVIPVIPDSFRYFNDEFEYAGYLLEYEGSKVISTCPRLQGKVIWTTSPGQNEIDLLYFLHDLHQSGIIHGDPRVDNVLKKDEQYKWIDFMQSGVDPTAANEKDFALLLNSLTGADYDIIFSEVKKIFRPTLSKTFSQMNLEQKASILNKLVEYLELLWSCSYQK